MCLSLQLNSLLEIFSSRPRAEQGWRERLSIDAGLNKVLTGLTKNSREYLSTGNGQVEELLIFSSSIEMI